jgi:hypothetical protein
MLYERREIKEQKVVTKFSRCERNLFHRWDFSSMLIDNITEVATYVEDSQIPH